MLRCSAVCLSKVEQHCSRDCTTASHAKSSLSHSCLWFVPQAIAPYGGQVTDILQRCCEDSYHEVCRQACRSIQQLVESVGMMLYSVSKHLMAAVIPLLTHKRHKASPALGLMFL